MMALAHDLDDLEEHIDKYGSVVAKQPDVWGQARLTAVSLGVRESDEEASWAPLAPSLQGSLSRTDQAYFSDALMLTSAAQRRRGAVRGTRLPSTATPTPIRLRCLPGVVNVLAHARRSLCRSLQPKFHPSARRRPATAVYDDGGRRQHLAWNPPSGWTRKPATSTISTSCVASNEGDDTADSPGYALNLVRIPVSVLPGKKTRIGHGAEATMTLTPLPERRVAADHLPQSGRQRPRGSDGRAPDAGPERLRGAVLAGNALPGRTVPVTECTKPAPACGPLSVRSGRGPRICRRRAKGRMKSQPAHPGIPGAAPHAATKSATDCADSPRS